MACASSSWVPAALAWNRLAQKCRPARPRLGWCPPDEFPANAENGLSAGAAGLAGPTGGADKLTPCSEGRGFRVAVVGCGYWGSKHVRVLHATEGVEEVAVVDSREDRVRSLARSYKSAPWHTALGPALDEVDAVVVATPPSTHVAVALQAIEAGKHVLVEKPLAPTSEGARQLDSAASAAGVILMVGHTFEYNPAVRKLRELVQNGELGEVYYIDSARLNLGLYQNDVNVILDLAPHDISIINNVLGRKPVAVQAWAARHAHRRFEDVAYLRLFYDDFFDDRGMSANIHVSWLDPCKVRRVTAVGSQKMAVYDDLATEERIRILDKGVCLPPDGDNGLAVVEALEAAEVSRRLGRPVLLEETSSAGRVTFFSNGIGHPPGSRAGTAPADVAAA